MSKKHCECPKSQTITAPFFILTYADMVTLLMCVFILLLSMSTLDSSKMEAQVGIIQGGLGMTKMHPHAPIQQQLPAPSIKRSVTTWQDAKTKPSNSTTSAELSRLEADSLEKKSEEEGVQAMKILGGQAHIEVVQNEDEIVLILPTYSLFHKDEYKIDPGNPEVIAAKKLYAPLAQQVASLWNYDISFVGHTDSLALSNPSQDGPKTKMELGFVRAMAVYDYFFKENLQDKSRVFFASQGDNVPVIQNAQLDSEQRKNRRVEVHLKKKISARKH